MRVLPCPVCFTTVHCLCVLYRRRPALLFPLLFHAAHARHCASKVCISLMHGLAATVFVARLSSRMAWTHGGSVFQRPMAVFRRVPVESCGWVVGQCHYPQLPAHHCVYHLAHGCPCVVLHVVFTWRHFRAQDHDRYDGEQWPVASSHLMRVEHVSVLLLASKCMQSCWHNGSVPVILHACFHSRYTPFTKRSVTSLFSILDLDGRIQYTDAHTQANVADQQDSIIPRRDADQRC